MQKPCRDACIVRIQETLIWEHFKRIFIHYSRTRKNALMIQYRSVFTTISNIYDEAFL